MSMDETHSAAMNRDALVQTFAARRAGRALCSAMDNRVA